MRFLIAGAAMLAAAALAISEPASAKGWGGGGGGGGGGHPSYSGGGRGPSAGYSHIGRSNISTYHGPHHSLSSHGPKHSLSSHGKLSSLSKSSKSWKPSTNKSLTHDKTTNKSLTHDKTWTHDALWKGDKFFHHHHHHFFSAFFIPVFWPFVFDYVFWPCDYWYYYSCYYGPFWAYGYYDLFGGIYWPYGYAGGYGGYAYGDRHARRHVARTDPADGASDELARLCGEEAAGLVKFPFDRIVERVQPTDAQRAALQDLKNATADAGEKLKSSCPTETAFTPVGRLDTAEQRFRAMRAAVEEVRAPLEHFYDSLTDQQKARFDVIGASREGERGGRKGNAGTARACGERTNGVAALPIDRIERTVQPNDAQRADLEALRTASANAADRIKAACPSETPLTAIGRLDAVEKRLDAMLEAIKGVRGPLEKFYGSLSDEQKARFNRMGTETQRAG
jgi:LTXXQ motif family protein